MDFCPREARARCSDGVRKSKPPTRPTRRPSKRGGNATPKCQRTALKIVRHYFSRVPDNFSDQPFSTHKRDFMRFSGSGLRFRSAIFDANMRIWPQKPSSKLHFSTQTCAFHAIQELRIEQFSIKMNNFVGYSRTRDSCATGDFVVPSSSRPQMLENGVARGEGLRRKTR